MAVLILPLLLLFYATVGMVVYTSVRLRRSGSPAFLAPVFGLPVGVYAGSRSYGIGFGASSILFGLIAWAAFVCAAQLAFPKSPSRSRALRVVSVISVCVVLSGVADNTARAVVRQRDRDRKAYVRRALESGQAGIVASKAQGWELIDVWPLSRTFSEGTVTGYEIRYRYSNGNRVRLEVYPNTAIVRRATCEHTETLEGLSGFQAGGDPLAVCEPIGFQTWRKRHPSGWEYLVQVRKKAIIVHDGLANSTLEVFAGMHEVTANELIESLVDMAHGPFQTHRRL